MVAVARCATVLCIRSRHNPYTPQTTADPRVCAGFTTRDRVTFMICFTAARQFLEVRCHSPAVLLFISSLKIVIALLHAYAQHPPSFDLLPLSLLGPTFMCSPPPVARVPLPTHYHKYPATGRPCTHPCTYETVELYEYCLAEGTADKNLIAKWKKVSLVVVPAYPRAAFQPIHCP